MGADVKAAVIGSTGYGGVELLRILLQHPLVEISSVVSSSSAGADVAEGYPHLTGIIPGKLEELNVGELREKADVVFLATPSGVSTELSPQLHAAGLKVIDLSGDLRLNSSESYELWYKRKAVDPEFQAKAVYGLTEINGQDVAGADVISNPGCYPTASLLALLPAVQAGWIDPATIIIDAKSGVSGSGRGLNLGSHYSEINENFKAYKLNQHQHIPEIEQVLSKAAGRSVVTTFSTHLVPMTRGILCTIYASVNGDYTVDDFIDYYKQFYEGRPFVRIRDKGKWPATKEVWGSNYCDIGFALDERTGRVTIVSVIDNLMKGAAGQAVQNLNVMQGWSEELGLKMTPVYP